MMANGFQDYYSRLGFDGPESFDKLELRGKFRRKAYDLHPDRNKGQDAEERFKELMEARLVLENDRLRGEYNKLYVEWRKEKEKAESAPDIGEIFAEQFGRFRQDHAIEELLAGKVDGWTRELITQTETDFREITITADAGMTAMTVETNQSIGDVVKQAMEWNPIKLR